MKAITFVAHQSQSLRLEQCLSKPSFKSTRRAWMRANVALRAWSRRIVASHQPTLMAVAFASTAAAFAAALVTENERTVCLAILPALAAAFIPVIKMSYDKIEEGGAA